MRVAATSPIRSNDRTSSRNVGSNDRLKNGSGSRKSVLDSEATDTHVNILFLELIPCRPDTAYSLSLKSEGVQCRSRLVACVESG